MQRGEQLVPFKTKSGDTLEILYLGELTAEVWELIMIGWLQMFAVVLDVFFYLTGVCVVSRRRCLPKNISITVWRPGDWGPQAGPSCSWAFSSPCASSTHWVNIDPLRQRRSCWSWHSLLPACSGLGSRSERAGVCGAEALRPVRVLLPVSSHHRSRLAFLPSTGGCGSGGARSGPGVPSTIKTSGQKERVTV